MPSEIYEFTKTDVCIPDLQVQINNSGLFDPIVAEWGLIEDSDQVSISMSDTISEVQEAQLENLVANHVCDDSGHTDEPDLSEDPTDVDNFPVDDTQTASTDVLWTSDKIQQQIDTAMLDTDLGPEYNMVSEIRTETSSKSWQTKMSLPITNLPNGEYLVSWFYEVNIDRCKYGEFLILYNPTGNDKDSYGDYYKYYNNDSITDKPEVIDYGIRGGGDKHLYDCLNGFRQMTLSGDINIELWFRSTSNHKKIKIRNARLHVRRIS